MAYENLHLRLYNYLGYMHVSILNRLTDLNLIHVALPAPLLI